jgi:hypothetical protein
MFCSTFSCFAAATITIFPGLSANTQGLFPASSHRTFRINVPFLLLGASSLCSLSERLLQEVRYSVNVARKRLICGGFIYPQPQHRSKSPSTATETRFNELCCNLRCHPNQSTVPLPTQSAVTHFIAPPKHPKYPGVKVPFICISCRVFHRAKPALSCHHRDQCMSFRLYRNAATFRYHFDSSQALSSCAWQIQGNEKKQRETVLPVRFMH